MMIFNMCERHPAHAGALIDELEQKLAVDEQFIDLVRAKLRVQVFDGHMWHHLTEQQPDVDSWGCLKEKLAAHVDVVACGCDWSGSRVEWKHCPTARSARSTLIG